MSSAYRPGGSDGNRSCPLSLVISVSGPPISAGELIADARTREYAALFVLDRAYERPRQPLGGSDSREQDTGDSDQQQECPPGSRGGGDRF